MVRIAINGFGRIGRLVYRIAHNDKKINVVAINDLTDTKTLAQLLQFDSVHGKFPENVRATKDSLIIGKKKIPVISEKDPSKLLWKQFKVDVVVESTGRFRNPPETMKHIEAGAKKVLLSATLKPKNGKIPNNAITLVLGVNEKKYNKKKHDLISNASCTTNNVSALLKLLNQKFGIKRCSFSTIHSVTSSQKLVDLPHSDLRRARAAGINIIPTSTSADKAAVQAIPSLKGKIRGFAFRVPLTCGSVTEFTIETNKPVTEEKVNSAVKVAAKGPLKGIIEYSTDELVSTDILGNPHSAIFDSKLTTVIDKKFLHVVAWYDNEWGYSSRMVDMIKIL
ncbi:type I glyceraldehyde-3-phosphate dehydrogenase [Candidatus Woesearchaeota archaeon]|nr:type I glyceraldehyde-3-phosphate dehydrogenase [Candidatus Woesearchaeota archaeon]MBT5739500.1 type I glyceraldehyde-3-phosphate dehydrogenase [Candidatus Woesearchaeota archaeon]